MTGSGGAAGRHSENGSAAVWAVLAVAVIATMIAGVMVLAGGYALRGRVRTAADLAALAGAAATTDGCRAARTVAEVNGARLVSCVCRGDCVVAAEIPLRGVLSSLPPMRAVARAGAR